MRFLLISRSFPPSFGGIQTYVYGLYGQLSAHWKVDKVTLGLSKVHLLWFFPWSIIRVVWLCLRNKYTHIIIGDSIMSVTGWIAKRLSGAEAIVLVHGLDIVYKNPIFQAVIPFFLKRMDKVVCNSRYVLGLAMDKGIEKAKATVILPAVDSYVRNPTAEEISNFHENIYREFNICLKNSKLLVTVCRLVERKGVLWFVENVVPLLSADYVYLVAGNGPEGPKLKELLKSRPNLSGRVGYLDQVSNKLRDLLYSQAALLVMPNRKIQYDVEGFGATLIEAGMYSLPVVTSKMEGMLDSVLDGRTGCLVEDYDNPHAFVSAIEKAQMMDRNTVRSEVASRFGWERAFAEFKVLFTK